jgi:hypothetical protein
MQIVLQLLLLSSLSLTHSSTCNVIVFGGGGSLGSHSAGAFKAFIDLLPTSSSTYSAIVGISSGSLNSMAIAQYPPGSEKAASDYILSVWRSLNGSSSVFEQWPGGYLQGLLFESGLFSTSPERRLLSQKITTAPQRKLSVGTVEINSGLYRTYNESLAFSDLLESGMCSSAIPVVFENQKFNKGVYCDGGLFQNFDAGKAVERCLEVTQDQKEIFLDILNCFGKVLPDEASKMKTIDVLLRGFEIRGNTGGIKSLNYAVKAFPDVNFRYYVEPSVALPKTDALNFTSQFINQMIDMGYSDAQKVINSGVFIKDLLKDDEIIYP